MSVCIECQQPVKRLINPDTRTVERCPHCDQPCDAYLEFSAVQLWIDVTLLRSSAWLHVLYNERWHFPTCTLLWLMCCLVDSVVALCTTDNRDTSITMAMHCNASGSIQVVRMTQNTDIESVVRLVIRTLPRLFFFAVCELALIAAVAVWVGSQLRSRVGDYERVLQRWAKVVAVAEHTKLLYILFFVWVMPSGLLVVVDIAFFLFLLRGFLVLTGSQPQYGAVLGLCACVACRFAFRHFTWWHNQWTCM